MLTYSELMAKIRATHEELEKLELTFEPGALARITWLRQELQSLSLQVALIIKNRPKIDQ